MAGLPGFNQSNKIVRVVLFCRKAVLRGPCNFMRAPDPGQRRSQTGFEMPNGLVDTLRISDRHAYCSWPSAPAGAQAFNALERALAIDSQAELPIFPAD